MVNFLGGLGYSAPDKTLIPQPSTQTPSHCLFDPGDGAMFGYILEYLQEPWCTSRFGV